MGDDQGTQNSVTQGHAPTGNLADTVPEIGDTVPSAGSSRRSGDELPPGTRIGRFVVVERVGTGGMGTVVAAYDPDLDRKVAVKLLLPNAWGGASASQGRERLLREARAMAKLSHPNVLTVHEVGLFEDRVFVAMEFAAGGTLSDWLAEPHEWREILDRFIAAGRGLAAAHAAGLVHRDFKPDNVLISEDGRVQVADFGLVGVGAVTPSVEIQAFPADAGVVSSEIPLGVSLTMTGSLLGTPAYMAPEQHKKEPVDARADQFAFCVSLYEALYGSRPFIGSSYWELASEVCVGVPRPVPAKSRVSTAVRDAIRRGLATKPDDRFPDMDALISALQRDPEAAARKRRRTIATVGSFLVLGAVAVFGLVRGGQASAQARCGHAADKLASVWNDSRKAALENAFLATGRPQAAGVAERVAGRLDAYSSDWAAARVDACEATHVRHVQSETLLDLRMQCLDRRLEEMRALIDLLSALPNADVLNRAVQAVAKLGGLEACADAQALALAEPPPSDPEVRAAVESLRARLNKAAALRKAGVYSSALGVARAVAKEARATGYAPLQADALYELAMLQNADGDAQAAEGTLEETLEEAARAHDDALTAHVLVKLLTVVGERGGRYEDALRYRPLAKAAIVRAGSDELMQALLADALGSLFYEQGKYDESRAQYERAFGIRSKRLGDDSPDVASSLNNLGVLEVAQGNYDEARRYYEQSLAIEQKVYGPEHPETADSLYNLGVLLFTQGKLDEARQFAERALSVRERILGPDHIDVAASLNCLGSILFSQGDLERASELLERSIAIRDRRLGPDHPATAEPLTNLGILLQRQGKLEKASAYLERALEIWKSAVGPEHANVGAVLNALGSVAERRGDLAQASSYYSQALAIWEKALGPDHSNVAAALTNLAQMLSRRGQYAEAKKDLDRALAIRTKAFGAEDPMVAAAMLNLGDLANQRGRYEQAIAHCERSLAIDDSASDSDSEALAGDLNCLGTAYLGLRRAGKALEPLRRAVSVQEAGDSDANLLARSRFLLARALYETHGDRRQTIDLAKQAAATYRAEETGDQEALAEVQRFLRGAQP